MTEVYEIGGRRFGVRWSRPGLDAELRAVATRAAGIQDAPPNVSVVVGQQTGPMRAKHQLYVQGQLTDTFGSAGGLLRAVVRALGSLAAEPQPGRISVNAFLLVDGGGAAVAVDRRLALDLRHLTPRIRRSGWRAIQVPTLDIDPRPRTVRVVDALGAVGATKEAFDARWPLGLGDDDLVSGELPVSRFVYAGRPEPESRGHAAVDMLPMVRGADGRLNRADAAGLATFTEGLPFAGVLPRDRVRLSAVLGLS